MSYINAIIIPSIIIGVTIIICLYILFKKPKRYIRNIYITILIGIAFALYFLIRPFLEIDSNWLNSLLINWHRVLQIFTADREVASAITEEISQQLGEGWERTYYYFLISFLFILAPVLTIGGLTQVFFNWRANFVGAYYSFSSKPLYIFSSLNKNTIVTGREIKEKIKKSHIIFYDPEEYQKDESFLREEAREIGALVIDKDIQNLTFVYNTAFFWIIGFVYSIFHICTKKR